MKESKYQVLLDHVQIFSSIERYGLMPGHLLAAHRDEEVRDCLKQGFIVKTSKAMASGMVVEGVVLTDRGSKYFLG